MREGGKEGREREMEGGKISGGERRAGELVEGEIEVERK